MIPVPRPISYDNEGELGKVRRRLFCRNYDACLWRAIDDGWPGFTCDFCPVFDKICAEEEPDALREALGQALKWDIGLKG